MEETQTAKMGTEQLDNSQTSVPSPKDFHSYSTPDHVRLRHIDLRLEVLFAEQTLHGIATLIVERIEPTQPLVLDTRHLKIAKVETSTNGTGYTPTGFHLGPDDPILGAPLTVQLPAAAQSVRIEYFTDPSATALQWLLPKQTAGRKRPFMFTQSETIYARSWIPLQDTPQVRVTYQAWVKTPPDLLAVMSAGNNPQVLGEGEYEFEMPQPIPSYLIALAIGDLRFQSCGPRTGVYAEPEMLERAVREFVDIEKMMTATEKLYGPYQWDRYDMLVLPASFPLGGMENPRLTFVTPTILAGDKSLVALIAHELAHSWSGNLVTNATWNDFWLNEGFTTYVERRIVEEVYGRRRAEMEATLGFARLKEELAAFEDKREILHADLEGSDPEDCFTKIPYEKGALFLRQLEEIFGRTRFDGFLRRYFVRFAFQSVTTEAFVAYLKEELFNEDPERASRIPLHEWLYEPGLPESAQRPASGAFAQVERQAKLWLDGSIGPAELPLQTWTTQEWLHFLGHLPKSMDQQKLVELDEAANLSERQNSEIAHQWLLISVRNRYEAANQRLEQYLLSTGREKLIKPLYEALAKSPQGMKIALTIYSKARSYYHNLVVTKIDKILQWQEQ
jgi:aminopeptidase N